MGPGHSSRGSDEMISKDLTTHECLAPSATDSWVEGGMELPEKDTGLTTLFTAI
jgi:hypothetical protein